MTPTLDAKGPRRRTRAGARRERLAERYARSLIEASLDPLVTISPEGKITDVNEATVKVTGVDRNTLIASDFSDYFTEPEKAREGYRAALAQGEVRDYALTIRHASGRTANVLYNATLYRNEAGEVQGVFAAARDVTESTRMEETARRLAAIVESSSDAIVGKTLDGMIVDWNAGAERLYGYDRDEVIGSPISIIVPDDRREELRQILARIARGELVEHAETVRVAKGGRRIDVSLTVSPIRDRAGAVVGASTIARDITELKRAEEAVKVERQRLKDVLEMLPAYVALLAPDYHVPFANRFFEERFGKSHGKRCYESLFGRTEPCERCETYTVFETNAPHQWEWTGPDGRHYDVHDFPFTDTDGSPLIMEMGIDITERKQAEEERRAASLYTRSLIEASIDPLVTISAGGTITDVNAATEAVTGRSRQELIGTDFSDYFTEPERARAGYQRVFRDGSVVDYPLEIRHQDGRLTPVLYNASVFHNAAGEVQGVFAAARDITQLRRTEDTLQLSLAELQRSNRELEQFAYVASHDLQEPLRMVASYTQLLAERYQDRLDADARDFIAFAVDGAKRMQRLIEDLLAYSRVGTRGRQFEPISSRAALGQAVANLRTAIEEASATVTSDDLPAVNADELQLVQLFQNLIGNAIKFHRPAVPPRVHVAARREGDAWVFSVRDNGIGIDAEFFARLFVVFQRLHGRDEYPGTGIGLPICKRIVERHGGRIWVESVVGTGTTFFFTMPALT